VRKRNTGSCCWDRHKHATGSALLWLRRMSKMMGVSSSTNVGVGEAQLLGLGDSQSS
jgi:hypothetical protein